jgi:hypothetical protein
MLREILGPKRKEVIGGSTNRVARNLMICGRTKYYPGDQVENGDTNGACGTNG